jgi:hypothetical protein
MAGSVFLTMTAIADAVRWAEEIMKEIDERWPVKDERGQLKKDVTTWK